MTPLERSISVGDAEISLREWEADGPPILFWHALGDHSSMQMVEAAPVLARWFGYRVVGIDAPGFGRSPRLPDERYEIAPLVELARDLLDGLGFELSVWSGSSWGATLGVHVGAAHHARLSALVLLDGGYMHSNEGRSLAELKEHWRSQDGFRYGSWEQLFDEARGYFGRWSPGLEAYLRASFRAENGAVVSIMGPDVYAAAMYGVQQTSPWHALQEVGESELPVLLLAATEVPPDLGARRAAGLERFELLVPQADIRAVEGSPHFLLEHRPGEIARRIGGWLQAQGYG